MPLQAELIAGVRHVVHDYANLVSAGTMKLTDTHARKALEPPVNTHVGEAFLFNCRKMYEFFLYPTYACKGKGDDIGASLYLQHCSKLPDFRLQEWARWHDPMNKQLLHVTFARVNKPKVWEGHDENKLFLDEFKSAWKLLLRSLADPFKTEFDTQIAARLNSEYAGLDLR
jgi:hypothetical protein